MRQLLKIAIGVSVIILFELFKYFLRLKSHDEAYYYFFFNLLSSYQILILSFCIGTLFLEEVVLRKMIQRNRIIGSSIIFFLFILICESICTYLLYNPKNIPRSILANFRSYYEQFDCKLIQYEAQATEFDKDLFYKLKDRHRFSYENKEFSNMFTTNSRGFRDNEAALKKPTVVCLGDSYTLGWGVEEREAFPAVIENMTGLKTLNAAMSSYGTARESVVLSSLDTSDLKFIIWQYCNNDDDENLSFINNNFKLESSPEVYFNNLVQMQKWTTTYFPGKHFLTILKMSIPFSKNKVSGLNNYMQDTGHLFREKARARAIRFLNIIAWSKINYKKTKIIVIELSPEKWASVFLDEVKSVANEAFFKQRFEGNLIFLDLRKILNRGDYYLLDLHLTKKGNIKVGTYLSKTINRLQGE